MAATVRDYQSTCLDLIRRGVRYGQGGGRCDPWRSGYCDCSGSICGINARIGAHNFGCTGSFDLSRQAHRLIAAGQMRELSIDDALATPCSVLFQGANEGQGKLDGSADGVWSGHVGIGWGDRKTTWEARGTRAGVGLFVAGSLRWDWACSPWPWLQPAVVAHPEKPEDVPYANAAALEDDDMLLMPKTRLTLSGRTATARAIPEFNFVLLEDGARMVGDYPVGDPEETFAHFWVPPKKAEVPGWQLVGISRVRHGQEAEAGLASQPNGYVVARYQYPNQSSGTYAGTVRT